MNKLNDLDKLKNDWLNSDQSFDIATAPGFEDYWEGLARFKAIYSVPKWKEFVEVIRGSVVFGKVYVAAMSDPQIAVAFTLIVSTLNAANPSEADLNFGLLGVDRILDDGDRAFIKQHLKANRLSLANFPVD